MGRRIAVIGSGQAGLVAAHGLVRGGHEVTVYSDRTPEQSLLEARPTGTAARFAAALGYERELDLAHWEAAAPKMRGAHVSFSPKVGNRLITLAGRMSTFCQAIDLRLQSHRWLTDLGDRVVVGKVDPDKLDDIARSHELVLVATGRGPLAELFPRNAERSVYTEPQRKLAMVITTGGALHIDGVPFLPGKFNLFGDAGEAFWIPYHHRDHGPSWCLLFEAKRGGRMDRFDGCRSGADVVATAKAVIADLMPWDADWVKPHELADPNGWLTGSVTPTVREPVARLPSGAVAMPLGDTAISLDPIAGQGANLGNKLARHIVEAVASRDPALPFDAAWMTATFEAFWIDHGAATVAFTNVLLEPMTAAGKLMFISQYGSDGTGDSPRQRIANAVVENFVDPRRYTHAFTDAAKARALLAELTGGRRRRTFAASMTRIAGKQLGRVFGRTPRHPLAPAPAPAATISAPSAFD